MHRNMTEFTEKLSKLLREFKSFTGYANWKFPFSCQKNPL